MMRERPLEPPDDWWGCYTCEKGECPCLRRHRCNYQDAADCAEFCVGECRRQPEPPACCECECTCELPSECYAAQQSPDHECECAR